MKSLIQRLESHWRNRLSIQQKIQRTVLLTATLVLLVACSVLFAYQFFHLRQNFKKDLGAVAQITADNSTAAVQFLSHDDTLQILRALKAKPHIVAGQLQDTQGEEIAYVDFYSTDYLNEAVADRSHLSDRGFWRLEQPIVLDGESIGSLILIADFARMATSLMTLYGAMVAIVLIVAFGFALLLAVGAQRLISNPILALADIAKKIADQEDYALRVERLGGGELSTLSKAFNQMLTQIEDNDTQLRETNRQMEAEIVDRIRAEKRLSRSEERFDLAVKGSRDGIWDWNIQEGTMFFSSRYRELLGVSEDAFPNHPNSFDQCLHPQDRDNVRQAIDAHLKSRTPYDIEFRLRHEQGDYRWFRARGQAIWDDAGQPSRMSGSLSDITELKAHQTRLQKLNQQLLDTSRQAGMAEVATGVLHNVGNVLNSVNVSAHVAAEKVAGSKVKHLKALASLIDANRAQLGAYITTDPKGQKVPDLLAQISQRLEDEQADLMTELNTLSKNVDHVKEIITMQQDYARVSGVIESLPVESLIEDAVSFEAVGLTRHNIQLLQEVEPCPKALVDRHKVLQILVNLIRNGKQAMAEIKPADRRLTVWANALRPDVVSIGVTDRGVGIPRENLTKIFQHGFTTRREGHGFGLHSAALAAKEMGGALRAESEGTGTGASFILELPVATATNHPKPGPKTAARLAEAV